MGSCGRVFGMVRGVKRGHVFRHCLVFLLCGDTKLYRSPICLGEPGGGTLASKSYVIEIESEGDPMPDFVPGMDLAEAFFREIIEPLVGEYHPQLEYTAALIGSGSEVLGFDSEMSTDHDWGPRCMLFLRPQDLQAEREKIHFLLSSGIPPVFMGFSTNFTEPDPKDGGTQALEPVTHGPIRHRVEMFTLSQYFENYLGLDPGVKLEPVDWLVLPHQKLRAVCAGRVFRDDLGFEEIRERLSWYPRDIWLYVMACCWKRIGQEEHLMGRAGWAGDEIGSSLIGSRLVRDVMRLAFFMERKYPPYAKWFGSAFAELACAREMTPHLTKALHAQSWQQREASLVLAYEQLARMHNELGITDSLPVQVSQFWGRPFKVIHGEAFAEALTSRIQDETIRALAKERPVGSVDLFSDDTDLLEDQTLVEALRGIYV